VKPPNNLTAKKTEDDFKEPKEKVLVTGDDVLIEYVSRVITALKSLQESDLRIDWVNAVDKFIKHYVWHTPDLKTT
jgi:hypothetical protein